MSSRDARTLRSHDGHFEMATPELQPTTGGFTLGVTCDFGGAASGHYLAPDPQQPERLRFQAEPYAWPSAREAFAALDRYAAQEDGK